MSFKVYLLRVGPWMGVCADLQGKMCKTNNTTICQYKEGRNVDTSFNGSYLFSITPRLKITRRWSLVTMLEFGLYTQVLTYESVRTRIQSGRSRPFSLTQETRVDYNWSAYYSSPCKWNLEWLRTRTQSLCKQRFLLPWLTQYNR